jgi:glutathione S-transferase
VAQFAGANSSQLWIALYSRRCRRSLRPAQPSADAAISSIPDYMRLNPNAVVPMLIHDGRIIIESTVIMHFVSTTCSVARR